MLRHASISNNYYSVINCLVYFKLATVYNYIYNIVNYAFIIISQQKK